MKRFQQLLLSAVGLLAVGCVADPRDPSTWIKKLDDPRESKDAVRELVKINDPVAVPPLINLYKKTHDPEHLRAIAHFKDKQSLPIMIDALDYSEDSFDTASIAATALGEIKDPSGVEPLMKVLQKPLPIKTRANVVKLEAMKSLAKIGDKRAVDALIKVVSTSADDQDFYLNKVAAKSLQQFADPKSIPTLVRGLFMTGRGADIFTECQVALVKIGEPAVQPLVELMQRKNATVEADAKKYEFIPGIIVQKAAIVLGYIRSKTAVPALVAEMAKPDEGLKAKGGVSGHQSVLLALGFIATPDAEKPLLATLNDPKQSYKLRAAAAEALNALGDQAAAPALVKVANEKFIQGTTIDPEHGQVVASAATAFSRLADADHATAALPKLPAELTDSDMGVALENAGLRLAVAKECKKDVACYVKKLGDKSSPKAEKAALMLSRLGKPGLDALLKAVSTTDQVVRMTVLFGIGHAADKSCGACREAIEKQIAADESKPTMRGIVDEMRVVLAQLSHG